MFELPLSEVTFRFVRSSGPGGQHVNKTSTQVEALFDVAHSPVFSDSDRTWLLQRLASKLDSEGVLLVTSQEHRSQLRNKNAAIEKLQSTIEAALVRPKKRKKTKPTRSSIEARLTSKKRAGEKKRNRSQLFD